jgi:hypothetical protein
MAALKRAILLDTNLLLLAAVGRFDKTLIGRKRLSIFTPDDFDLLIKIHGGYRRSLTTPHLLTELSNLADQCVPHARHIPFRIFLAAFMTALEEQWMPAQSLCQTNEFRKLGLADAAACLLADSQATVITVDGSMYNLLLARGIDACNFNHLRNI